MKSDDLKEIINNSNSRFEIWEQIFKKHNFETVAEVGIFRGNFSTHILRECDFIKKYYMIDPWRHISRWNVPANISDIDFKEVKKEALDKTEFAGSKRIILEGTTTEIIDEIPDNSLDFVYIDGDHTLRGITIDLIKWYPKIKEGGYIGGDDFGKSIFPQPLKYEPSPIFPYAVYFAEAMDAPIWGMPGQFLMHKDSSSSYAFHDLTGDYTDTSMRSQIVRGPLWYFKKQYLSPIYQKILSLIK